MPSLQYSAVMLCRHIRGQIASLSFYSALLYMNDDFEGGEFIFTEMDAKTVTVSQPILANLSSIFSLNFATFQRLLDFKYF